MGDGIKLVKNTVAPDGGLVYAKLAGGLGLVPLTLETAFEIQKGM